MPSTRCGACVKYVKCGKKLLTHFNRRHQANSTKQTAPSKQHQANGTKQVDGKMPLRSTTAKWLGSCSVIASALPVLTESVLDAETCAHINKFVIAKPGDQVDFMTRAAVLQKSLASLTKPDWHGELRAFAGPTDQFELTPRPGEWEKYYELLDDENEDDEEANKKRYDDSYLAGAWDFLTKNADVPVIVTRYPAEESAAGQIGAHKHSCVKIWENLPKKLKYTKQVAMALAKAYPQGMFIDKFDFPEKHYISIAHNDSYHFQCVPETLKQNKEFCAKASELAYYKHRFSMPNVPPRVLHNPFSDYLHGQLSPGEYTRQDVLERVKLCGNVLKLHDPVYHADMEIVAAALATSRGLYVCELVSKELRDDLEFMTDAIQKNPWCVLVSSTRLRGNVDFCKMALAKTYRSVPLCNWRWFPKSMIDSSPDVAAYFLALAQSGAPLDDTVQVNIELMVDLAGRDTDVLRHLLALQHWGVKAANKLLQDDEFLLACVRQNWRNANKACNANGALEAEILDVVCNHFGHAKWGLRRALSELSGNLNQGYD